jgi:uncharacterized protein YdeI (YjbR/CyaY-like superfamily)
MPDRFRLRFQILFLIDFCSRTLTLQIMATRDPRIDQYIAKAAPFAPPILQHLRQLVHSACPEVEETMKWSFPHFMYRGMLCSMSAFKQHCAFGFWKGDLMFKDDPVASGKAASAMGHLGRITGLSDLPPDKVLIGYIKEAVRLNDAGIVRPVPKRVKVHEPLQIPDDLTAALRKKRAAREAFEKFSYSHRKEYVEWITEAKRDETRQKRLQRAVELIASGKPRYWKYA